MTEERRRELATLERMMTSIPGFDRSDNRVPRCCEECEYHQPDWKYRFCYHTHCPYHLKASTIRKAPLTQEPFPVKEVVVMNGV